jgi:hypothetical protein
MVLRSSFFSHSCLFDLRLRFEDRTIIRLFAIKGKDGVELSFRTEKQYSCFSRVRNPESEDRYSLEIAPSAGNWHSRDLTLFLRFPMTDW